jgi:hypothetical protein
MTTKFQTSKLYGNDLTIEILSRTAKTVTIKSSFGEQRVKVREYTKGVEAVMFKSWYILSTEDFNKKEAIEIANYNAYYR